MYRSHRPDATVSAGQLLCRYRQGDSYVTAELMHRFERLLVGVARKYLQSDADVADALQETWMTFVRKHESIEDPECVGGWLQTTCARASITIAVRRHRHELILDRAHEVSSYRVDDMDDLDLGGRRDAVRNAIDRLPDEERKLIEVLTADPPASYISISNESGRPIGSIGPTRQRILRRLRTDPAIQGLKVAS